MNIVNQLTNRKLDFGTVSFSTVCLRKLFTQALFLTIKLFTQALFYEDSKIACKFVYQPIYFLYALSLVHNTVAATLPLNNRQ